MEISEGVIRRGRTPSSLSIYNSYGHERYVLSLSENVLIDWASLMSFGSSFQLLAAENLKAFLAILVEPLVVSNCGFCFSCPHYECH